MALIESISDLIERLESVRADIPLNDKSFERQRHLGWIRRPLEALLEQAREEADAIAVEEPRLKTLAKCGERRG